MPETCFRAGRRVRFTLLCLPLLLPLLAACPVGDVRIADMRPGGAQAGDAQAVQARAGELRLVILHTNDVHGQVLPRKATWLDRSKPPEIGGLARLAAFVRRAQDQITKEGGELLVVDAGDWFQGTPEGLIGGGKDFTAALTRVGYDALAIGNHEFDFGIANLVRLLQETHVPAVACNLMELEGSARVDWVEPWRIVERGGLRIALVGIVTPITPEITHPDARTIRFEDPAVALTRAREELEGRCDLLLPLTHLGVDDDRVLARAHPDLPLIVGGHSHTYLEQGVREGDTLIVQCGSKASAVGWVELRWDLETRRVSSVSARVIDLLAEPEARFRSAAVESACAELERRSAERMGTVVGQLTAPLTRSKDPLRSSTAGNLIADALKARGRAEVGLVNRGGIRSDLQAGPVTRRDVFEILPFENNLVVLKLSGAELQEMLRRSVEGAAHSGLEVSGLIVEAQLAADGARLLAGLEVNGEPLAAQRVYRVATLSFLADGGDLYLERVPAGERRTDDVLLARDVLELAFEGGKPLTPPAENRYRVVAR